MKRILTLVIMLVISAVAANAQWTNGQSAGLVIGQEDFTSKKADTDVESLRGPYKVAIDYQNAKMYVVDNQNNRVLRFAYPPTANQPDADLVFGQPNFTSRSTGTTASSLSGPTSATIYQGTLWVVDEGNNRVLRYDNASTRTSNGSSANGVLGQANFTSSSNNNSMEDDQNKKDYNPNKDEPDDDDNNSDNEEDGNDNVSLTGFNSPYGCAIDSSGNLYVSDEGNNRVLRFNSAASKSNGAAADGVLGQSVSSTTSGSHATTTQSRMRHPRGITIDANGTRLWVADTDNHRVLRFDNAASKSNGANADGVLGQSGFTSRTHATTANNFKTPSDVACDHNGNLYVVDTYNHRVVIFNAAAGKSNGANADYVIGQTSFTTKSQGTTASRFKKPRGICVDSYSGCIYVADDFNNRVLRFCADSELPVELVNFELIKKSNSVLVEWATGSEVNNAGFEVYRSSDNDERFIKIGSYLSKEALRGLGTDPYGKNYSFEDEYVGAGTYQYKLVDVALDGQRTEHAAKSIVIEENVATAPSFADVMPNPAFDHISVKFFVQDGTEFHMIEVYSALGEKLYSTMNSTNIGDGQGQVSIPVNGFHPGTYFVRISGANGAAVKSFVVAR